MILPVKHRPEPGKRQHFYSQPFTFYSKKPAANNSSLRALIIAPTRELAIQILNDAEKFNKHCGLRLALVYGGVDYEKQRNSLEGWC